jgi:hypothetical protein
MARKAAHRRTSRRTGGAVRGLTLDTGPFIAAEREDRRFWQIWKEMRERKAIMTVPTVVLAQAWRGNNVLMSIALKGCRVDSHDEATAKLAGELLAKTGTADIVDAIVVLGAIARGDAIVTSDRADMERLITGAGAAGVLILDV